MKITFLASPSEWHTNILHYYQDIQFDYRMGFEDLVVSDLSTLSFDLLDNGFKEIELFYRGEYYDLKLGKNTWTEKELRKEHNLLKLVVNSILNK
jgi:hypothetical protein